MTFYWKCNKVIENGKFERNCYYRETNILKLKLEELSEKNIFMVSFFWIRQLKRHAFRQDERIGILSYWFIGKWNFLLSRQTKQFLFINFHINSDRILKSASECVWLLSYGLKKLPEFQIRHWTDSLNLL